MTDDSRAIGVRGWPSEARPGTVDHGANVVQETGFPARCSVAATRWAI